MSDKKLDTNTFKQVKTPDISQSQNSLTKYSSRELFHGMNELIIIHAQKEYRLRITRNNKLILTK